MQYASSQVSRRIVGRFEQGDRLPEALMAVCQREGVEAGQVRAEGVLSRVELGLFDIEQAGYREAFAAEGAFELLSFHGVLSKLGPEVLLNAHLVVAYAGHGQSHVVGGQLREAVVHAVDFVIDVFEDVHLTRSLDRATGLPLLAAEPRASAAKVSAPAAPAESGPKQASAAPRPSPAPAEDPTASAAGARTASPEAGRPKPVEADSPPKPLAAKAPAASEDEWAAAARRSQAMMDSLGDESEWVELEPGDILMHPRLGECVVVRIDDETSAYIRIKKSRRISKLALSVVRLEEVDERDGKRVFNVHAGRS